MRRAPGSSDIDDMQAATGRWLAACTGPRQPAIGEPIPGTLYPRSYRHPGLVPGRAVKAAVAGRRRRAGQIQSRAAQPPAVDHDVQAANAIPEGDG
jgi:hypothetical protein